MIDQLMQVAKQLFPNASPEELEAGIKQILEETPDADPNDIIEAAKGIKGAIDSGEWQKQIDGELDNQVNKKLKLMALEQRAQTDGENFLKQFSNKGE